MSKTTVTIICPRCDGTGWNAAANAACPSCLGQRHVEADADPSPPARTVQEFTLGRAASFVAELTP